MNDTNTTVNKPSILAIVVMWAIVLTIDSIVGYYIGLTLDVGFYLCMVVALVFIIVVTRTRMLD